MTHGYTITVLYHGGLVDCIYTTDAERALELIREYEAEEGNDVELTID